MTRVIGVVQDIRSRDTRAGTMYDVVVDGNSYGNGKYSPRGVSAGDTVEFEVEISGNYKNIARNSLRKVDARSAPPVDAPRQRSSADAVAAARALPPSDAQRQQIISKQAALNTAVAHVSAMLKAECIPLPTKVADRMGYVNSLVLAYASGFHNISVGAPIDFPEGALDVEVLSPKKASSRSAARPPTDDHVEAGAEPGDDIPF